MEPRRALLLVLFAPMLLAAVADAQAAGTVIVADMACEVPPDRRPEVGAASLRAEFVEFENVGDMPADLGGWTFRNAPRAQQPAPDTFVFPAGQTLAAGARVRVHTGSAPEGTGALSWGRDVEALRDDDAVTLLTPGGEFAHAAECSAFRAPCPNVELDALRDGSVRIAYAVATDARPDRWHVYRSVDGGESYQKAATLSGLVASLVDANAPRGATLRYIVEGESADARAQGCAATSVATASRFPLGWAAGLIGVVAVAGYFTLRR